MAQGASGVLVEQPARVQASLSTERRSNGAGSRTCPFVREAVDHHLRQASNLSHDRGGIRVGTV